MDELRGRVCLITGAASGIGLALAQRAARSGMKLVLSDINQDALEAARVQFHDQGVEVVARRADVSRADEVRALAEAALAAFGTLHLVFNNAGVITGGLIWEHSARDWNWLLGVNLWGVIHGVSTFTPIMLAESKKSAAYQGHIVNTASMAGLVNVPATGLYNVSKHAIVSLTETLYQDLALVTSQVHCSVLCPYFVPTGLAASQAGSDGQAPTRSQTLVKVMLETAINSAKLSAQQIAEATFAAIARNGFYVFSHPHALGGVRTRLQDILESRNPSDPYADHPKLRQQLLRGLTDD